MKICNGFVSLLGGCEIARLTPYP
jgi:hypothetical protein